MHVRDISEKYLIQGETQDTAFMFVPSESVFAEIHENFEAIVHKAHRARIVIVSPSLLMLSIQVIQAILKDARMREQAHLIQGEVIRLMEDVSRLDERVRKLQSHFGQSAKDIDDILVSTSKVTKRGQKIEALEFGAQPTEGDAGSAETTHGARREGRSGCARRRLQDRPAETKGGRRRRTETATAPRRSLCLRTPAAKAAPSGARSVFSGSVVRAAAPCRP